MALSPDTSTRQRYGGSIRNRSITRRRNKIEEDSYCRGAFAYCLRGSISTANLSAGPAGQGRTEWRRAGWDAAVYQLLERCFGGGCGTAKVCSRAGLEYVAWCPTASVLSDWAGVLDGC